MKTTQMARRFVITSLLTVLVPIVLFLPEAYAETYVAGQFGLALPSIGKGLTDVDLRGVFPAGSTMSDRALKTSALYGVKLGYFFPQAPWFGVETEIFNTTPHIKQQFTTVSVPPGPGVAGGVATGTVSGDHFRVFTWAPLNLVFRYPSNSRLQPYVAVGPGVFFARVESIATGFEGSQSSTKLGLNTQVGFRYFMTRHVSVFGEWKYDHARFTFKENDTQFGFNGNYNMHQVAFGIGYHF
jgi:opacity protein-like surface antigen